MGDIDEIRAVNPQKLRERKFFLDILKGDAQQEFLLLGENAAIVAVGFHVEDVGEHEFDHSFFVTNEKPIAQDIRLICFSGPIGLGLGFSQTADGELDRSLEVELLEGFCDKGRGPGISRAVKGGIVGVGSKINDGNVFLLKSRGGFYAIQFAFQMDIEQEDVRWVVFDMCQCVFSPWQDVFDWDPLTSTALQAADFQRLFC
jgi:hypothetical protein